MLQFHVDETLCVRCGECEADCPAGIIAMNDLPEIIDEERCYRCLHCYAVCPTGALSILGNDPAMAQAGPDAPELPSSAQMGNLIRWRRSVRRYQDENLPPELIDELLDTACHAPTGVNARDVLFTVVRNKEFMAFLSREIMARLSELEESGRLPGGLAGQYLAFVVSAWKTQGRDVILRGAPHLLVTSAPKSAPCPVQDTHIALVTFELLASSHGLGTLWDGLFMMALSVCPDLVERLGIPADHTLGYAMLFGKPAVEYHRPARRGPVRVNMLG
ncbi:nitroreductase family protein [Fundidesulfovibrio putealis]|uniref:nitroreductase family protein n=1 Tax=Fundidesulfovibrio putealis TaxID=270496 RepID=UPI000405B0D1|nr:nitroreductase family protein [Fundidesulfovibrio putealis]